MLDLGVKFMYQAKYGDETDHKVKGAQRDERIDKRKRAREDFMKINSRGLKSDILPTIAKKTKGE